MPFVINDNECSVAQLAPPTDDDGQPTGATVVSAEWVATDTADDGTDVSIVSGDASSGTSDDNLNSVTASATGTGIGAVAVQGTITYSDGAVVTVIDSGVVNPSQTTTTSLTWGPAQPLPA